jgi:hypothetical protein
MTNAFAEKVVETSPAAYTPVKLVSEDLPFWNEFKPAKKCWSVLWVCLPNWSSDFDPDQYLSGSFEDEDDDEHDFCRG